jgi:uncharacterized protein (DUF3820 family)
MKFYYISTGEKQAMRTLRHIVSVPGVHYEDSYICNLCRDYDDAVAKARSIIGNSAELKAQDFDLNDWGQGFTVKRWMRLQLEQISLGIMPFGKHKNEKITDLSESYVRYWVEQTASNIVGQKLIQVFTDIANLRGYFEKWEAEAAAKEAALQERISKMNHVGKVGSRAKLFIRCDKVMAFDGYYGTTYMNICTDRYGNRFVYRGSNAWEENKYYSVVATIKEHSEYKGMPQTIISRPKVEKVIEKEAESA